MFLRSRIKHQLNRLTAFIPQFNRVFVHIQVNMLIHHLLAHLLGMRADKFQTRFWVSKRKLHRLSQYPVYFMLNIQRQITVCNNATQWYGTARLFLPVVAQVDYFLKALILVSKAVLVIMRPTSTRPSITAFSISEKTNSTLFLALGKAKPNKKLAVVYFPGIPIL